MLFRSQGSSISKNVVTRKYLISISDLVNKDSSNENHVLSDCESYCYQLPAYLKQVRNSGVLGAFNLTEDITSTDFTDRGTDTVAGYEFEITLNSNIGAIGCDLPIEDGDILDNNYIYVGGTYTPITSSMSIATEEFIYGTDPVVLANTPTNILTVFAGASILFNTDDYTRVSKTFTITSPIVQNGDKIRITYTY